MANHYLTVFTDNKACNKHFKLNNNNNRIEKVAAGGRLINGSSQTVAVNTVHDFLALMQTLIETAAVGLDVVLHDHAKAFAGDTNFETVKYGTSNFLQEGELARVKANYFAPSGLGGWLMLDFDPDEAAGYSFTSFEQIYNELCRFDDCFKRVPMLFVPSSKAKVKQGLVGNATFSYEGFGCHVYILIANSAERVAIGERIKQRSWLMGRGWFKVSKNGSLLERGLFDWLVFSDNRIIFEGLPNCDGFSIDSSKFETQTFNVDGQAMRLSNMQPLSLDEKDAIALKIEQAKDKVKELALQVQESYGRQETTRLLREGYSAAKAKAVVVKQSATNERAYLDDSVNVKVVVGLKIEEHSCGYIRKNKKIFEGCRAFDPFTDSDRDNAEFFVYTETGEIVLHSFVSNIDYVLDYVRPEIFYNDTELKQLAEPAFVELAATGKVFNAKGQIVAVSEDIKGNTIVNYCSKETDFLTVLNTYVKFFKIVGRERVKTTAKIGNDFLKYCLEQANSLDILPKIDTVIDMPFVTADNQIISKEGYNAEHNVFITKAGYKIELLEKNGEVEWAEIDKRLKRVSGFWAYYQQFARHESDALNLYQAPFLAAVSMSKQMPILGFLANQSGMGKTTLTHSLSALVGDWSSITPRPGKSEELEKQIASVFCNQLPAVIFDNFTLAFNSNLLCSITTTEGHVERKFGRNDEHIVFKRKLVLASSNTGTFNQDLVRRVITVNMIFDGRELADKGDKNIVQTVGNNRTQILNDIFSIYATAFKHAGKQDIQTLGFDAWDAWVNNTFRWLQKNITWLPQNVRLSEDIQAARETGDSLEAARAHLFQEIAACFWDAGYYENKISNVGRVQTSLLQARGCKGTVVYDSVLDVNNKVASFEQSYLKDGFKDLSPSVRVVRGQDGQYYFQVYSLTAAWLYKRVWEYSQKNPFSSKNYQLSVLVDIMTDLQTTGYRFGSTRAVSEQFKQFADCAKQGYMLTKSEDKAKQRNVDVWTLEYKVPPSVCEKFEYMYNLKVVKVA